MFYSKETIKKRWWVILIALFVISEMMRNRESDATSKSSSIHASSSLRGNEQSGEMINYCPVCGEDAQQAYVEQYGQIIKEGYFCKGCPMVCYSCAKKLQAEYYNGYSSQ